MNSSSSFTDLTTNFEVEMHILLRVETRTQRTSRSEQIISSDCRFTQIEGIR